MAPFGRPLPAACSSTHRPASTWEHWSQGCRPRTSPLVTTAARCISPRIKTSLACAPKSRAGDMRGYASRLCMAVAMLVVAMTAADSAQLGCNAAAVSADVEKKEILAVIAGMEQAWNRGNFRGYMEGFANPDVVFVSRGEFQKDWQGTLDHYFLVYCGWG